MSQSERGEAQAAASSAGRAARPSLDRPSLFAGMEDDHEEPSAAKRVRILSTLDAPRAASHKGMTRPRHATGRPQGWLLWLLLSAGLVCSGVGWWLSTQAQDHAEPEPTALTQAAPRSASSPAPRPSEAVQAASRGATPLAALIETPPARGPESAASPPTTVANTAATASSPSAVQAGPLAALAAAPAAPAASARAGTHTNAAAPRRKSRADDDVALLEAMFAHAGTRKPPRSASEELERRCGPLNGADARQCRIKVCKRFPDARVCR